jgi:hypothetical protein
LQAVKTNSQKLPVERHKLEPIKGASFGLCRKAPFFISRKTAVDGLFKPGFIFWLIKNGNFTKLYSSQCDLKN